MPEDFTFYLQLFNNRFNNDVCLRRRVVDVLRNDQVFGNRIRFFLRNPLLCNTPLEILLRPFGGLSTAAGNESQRNTRYPQLRP